MNGREAQIPTADAHVSMRLKVIEKGDHQGASIV